MNRRGFLALGSMFSFSTEIMAMDYRKYYPRVWRLSSLNDTAIALYGHEKFLSLKKSKDIVMTTPTGIVKDRENISIAISSTIEAKTLAIFQDMNEKSLVAVFSFSEESLISCEFMMRMEQKGTLFAVIESVDGKLYYTRKYIDILTLNCMVS